MSHTNPFMVHPTAELSPLATVGQGTKIWNYAQIRERAQIGAECIIGKNVYIDFEVHIGARCKIQNNSSIYHGSTLEEGVFIGPPCHPHQRPVSAGHHACRRSERHC